MLDGEGGQVGITDQVAAHADRAQEATQNR